MNFDDKTDSFDLNQQDDGATESIDLNSQASKPTESIEFNSQSPAFATAPDDQMIGTVINGYTVTSFLSAATGEAEIFLASKGDETAVIKYYHSNMKPNEEILEKIHNLDHPDIIKLFDYGTFKGRFFEIMEYAPFGTLADTGADGSYKYIPMSEDLVVKVIAETVNAFHYFHGKGIIHRDIKPLNMFCRNIDEMNIIIGDFGISSELDVEGGMSKKMTSSGSRTIGYAAPELYGVAKDDNKSKILIGPEIDYYALGVTVFELLTGTNIFAGRNELNIMRDTIQGRIIEDMLTRPEASALSPRMRKLIQGLLTVRHDKRWGFTQVSDWLTGKDVVVFANIPLREFEPLKFGDRILNSIDEVAAALDSDRVLAKKFLMRAELEKWAARAGEDKLSDEITSIRESDADDDMKVSVLLYILNPNLPCRIDEKTSIKEINGFIEMLRKRPETMADLILGDKKSDLYPWLNTLDREIPELIRKEVGNYRREGDASKRLSVVSNIYLAFAGSSIKPFRDDEYELSTVDDLRIVPKEYRKKVIGELENSSSILYIWLLRQRIPSGFERDWASMERNWTNLSEILSGNIEYIRKRKIKEAKRVPRRLRRIVLLTGGGSAAVIIASLTLCVISMSGFYKLPFFSPYAKNPVPKRGALIYEKDSAASKRVYAAGNLVLFSPPLARSDADPLKGAEMVPVKYYSQGIENSGFMRIKDLYISYIDYRLLFFYMSLIIPALFSLAGIIIALAGRESENFFSEHKMKIAAAGVTATLGAAAPFILPLYIFHEKWCSAKDKSDSQVEFIKSSRFTSGGQGAGTAGLQRVNFKNGDSYYGQMKDGKMHGYGIYTFADGDRYEGDWADNKRSGRGVYAYAGGGKYEGGWIENEMHGQGVFVYQDGSVYEGGWSRGVPQGTCKLAYGDGGRYEGEVQNGQKNGKGTMTYPDGAVKKGEWKDGEFLG